jgi:hypothetical protein
MADGSLEKYLRNEPLTPELAALARGEDEIAEKSPKKEEVDFSFTQWERRPLDDDDREHMRRMTLEAGWPVFLRLIDNYIATQEDLAKQLSLSDPLGDEKKLAQTWAYVAMYGTAKQRFIGLLAEEIHKLAKAR